MRRSSLLVVLVGMVLLGQAGCAAMTAMNESSRSMLRAFKPGGNYADSTEGPDDAWIQQAGEEARQNHAREPATEPLWFRKLTMSDRARGIERNVGIDEN